MKDDRVRTRAYGPVAAIQTKDHDKFKRLYCSKGGYMSTGPVARKQCAHRMTRKLRCAGLLFFASLSIVMSAGAAWAVYNDEVVEVRCGGSGCVSARVQSEVTSTNSIDWRTRGATDPAPNVSIYLRYVALYRFENFKGESTETLVGFNGNGGQCFCPVVRFTDPYRNLCGGYYGQTYYSTAAANYIAETPGTPSGCRV